MTTTNDTPIQAIPTIYRGIEFRSRMEAKCAATLDRLEWKWQYEPFSVLLKGISYRPDFYIPDLALVVECRGYQNELGDEQMRVFGEAVRSGLVVPGFGDIQWYLVYRPGTNQRISKAIPSGLL